MSRLARAAGRSTLPRALTVAGSDPSGGAGVQADLKTFEAHRVWGLSAVVAVTVQDTLGLAGMETVSVETVRRQVAGVVLDIGVDAAKTGMLATGDHVVAVARVVSDLAVTPLVVDPVLTASAGGALLDPDGLEALRVELLPLATLVTPNLAEASALVGGEEVADRAGMLRAARQLAALGPSAVLVTGGHLPGAAVDLLVADGEVTWLEAERLAVTDTHGTGCVLSAAIAARLARGEPLTEAVWGAKRFVGAAIAGALRLGRGAGPVDPGAVPPALR